MLFLDGVYVEHEGSTARFRWVKAPTDSDLTQLTHKIAQRLKRVFGIDIETCAACGGAVRVICLYRRPCRD